MSKFGAVKHPAIFQIETTNVCNMRCAHCPRSRMTRRVGHMDLSLFKLIVERDMGATVKVGLHILGEPTLHPDLVEMVACLTAAGIVSELATNGLALSAKLALGLMAAGLDTIWFSLDAACPETYAQVRSSPCYSTVVRNVERFLDLKMKARNPVRVVLQMVEHPWLQAGESEEFLRRWSIPGVDRVAVKFLDSWAGTLFEHEVAAPGHRHPCAEPFQRVAVLQDGSVVPCCRDWDGKYVYGNLKKESLAEVWAGPRVAALREEMESGHWVSEPCASCKEFDIPMDRDVIERS